MALCCGCEIHPGEPIDPRTLREHYKHTIEVLLFWELMMRESPVWLEGKLRLSQARIDLLNIIDLLYPEVRETPGNKGGDN